ncbi:hypothetical protein [Pseudomonas corrugata]
MTDQPELQGEIAALCCFIVALGSILPLSCQIRLSPAFESRCEAMRQRLTPEEQLGFDKAALSLKSTRQVPLSSAAQNLMGQVNEIGTKPGNSDLSS